MKQPPQEDLIGYVLGALDADQQDALQKLIDENPQLEEQLLDIKSSLLPLELLDEQSGIRPGLARRTCEMVASSGDQWTEVEHDYREPLLSSSTWSARDFLFAAASIAILAGILIPVLDQTKYQSQIVKCRGNLMSIGKSLASYDDAHGHLPMVRPGAPAEFIGLRNSKVVRRKISGKRQSSSLRSCPQK